MFKLIIIGFLLGNFCNNAAQEGDDMCAQNYATCSSICEDDSITKCSISIYVYPQLRRRTEITNCNGVKKENTVETVENESAMNVTCRIENSMSGDDDNFVEISNTYSNIYTTNMRNKKK